jgi:ligand-binding sensor domain-containing protein
MPRPVPFTPAPAGRRNLTGGDFRLSPMALAVVWCCLMAPFAAVGAPRPTTHFQFDNWQLDDGLPQNSVTCIIQSPRGYLWIGTYHGLVRFDGVQFKVFDQGNAPELHSNRILRLHEDRHGYLWIGTEGAGLTRYKDGRFQHVPHPLLSNSSITAICDEGVGPMWFATATGAILRLEGTNLTDCSAWYVAAGGGAVSMQTALDGGVWLATPEYLGVLETNRFRPLQEGAELQPALGQGRREGLWLAAGGRLKRLKKGGGQTDLGLIPLARSGLAVTALHEDRSGKVWIGTYGGGLVIYQDGKFQKVTARDGLSNDTVLSVYEDREENIWVGTHGGGLNRLKARIFESYESTGGLSENVVLSICQDRAGAIWMGTDGGGLNRLWEGQFTVHAPSSTMPSASVWSVFEDRRTNLWVGTGGSGLYLMKDGRFILHGRRMGLFGRTVRAIYEDRAGALWVGTYNGGLDCLRDGRFVHFGARNGLSHNDVVAIQEDQAGDLWVGTGGGGLNRLRKGVFACFGEKDGLPSNFIRTLFLDSEGVLWAGTGNGLSRLKRDHFTSYTRAHGLPGDSISQIFEDDHGQFWMGSNRGIFRVPKRDFDALDQGRSHSLTCVLYDRTDGLGSRECTGGFQPSGCKTRDGRLLFPTIKGVAVVDPNNLKINKRPPRVVIEDLLADGRPVSLEGPVRIPPGAERFEFRYTGLSFSAPKRVRFRYMLEGLEEDWTDAETRRAAYYNQIPPGDYRFRVIAANNDGLWNEVGSTLEFTVLAPFWRKPWFVALSATVSLAGFGAGARWVAVRKLRSRLLVLEQQNALQRERARIANDMHDNLGARLTRIALLGELARRDARQPDAVGKHTEKIS